MQGLVDPFPDNPLSFDGHTYRPMQKQTAAGKQAARCFVNIELLECFLRSSISNTGMEVLVTAWKPSSSQFDGVLQKICVPESIKRIGKKAFYCCFRLTHMVFEAGSEPEEIGLDVCRYSALLSICLPRSIKRVVGAFGGSSLRSVFFEQKAQIAYIGDAAFRGCFFQAIRIPSSVERLGNNTFNGCKALNFVTFEPESKLRAIDAGAFMGCLSLSSIFLPRSVQTLGLSVFSGCPALTEVIFEEGSVLSLVNGAAFRNCTALRSISIPRRVQTLGESAFKGCLALTTVTFEAGSVLSSVNGAAFLNCSSLRSISIPRRVQTLGLSVFKGCLALTTVTFGQGSAPLRIKEKAFEDCPSLRSLRIPKNREMTVQGALPEDCVVETY
ncbi:MAG: leucine-rich repeat domain-containing protein [Holosporales bacterium]|nr:leucine-rich repeat domain-containing protein [Holosporales bacterium]